MRMPVIFVGHGSPENAVEDNEYTRNWKILAAGIQRPKAILCVSAHWVDEGATFVTGQREPRTIHDFYGFPEELYRMQYNAPGSPAHAGAISKAVKTAHVRLDSAWGLDHGAWSVLANMYPLADIPVLQLSLDYDLPPEKHFAIGKELAAMREKGVLIIGSGNLVHNLRKAAFGAEPYGWALAFDSFVKDGMRRSDTDALVNFAENRDSAMAHPTSEHYLPLLYALGAAGEEEPQFFNEGIFASSIAMRCAVYGAGLIPFGPCGIGKKDATDFEGMASKVQRPLI